MDAQSKSSSNQGFSETQSMRSRKPKDDAQQAERKKLKVLKQALKDERAIKTHLEDEIKVLTERNKELSKENESMSNKYLGLYDENDKLQEMLVSLQYKIQASKSTNSTIDLEDFKGFDFLKKGSSSKEAEIKRKEMEQQHESDMTTMQMSMKKLEKELGYKDEEIRHFKNMAS